MSDSPTGVWEKLQATSRPSRVVAFPRANTGELRIWVLTQEEEMGSIIAADRLARERLRSAAKTDMGYEALYAAALSTEILFRACRDVTDPSRPAFPSPQQLRQMVTTEECDELFGHYLGTLDDTSE